MFNWSPHFLHLSVKACWNSNWFLWKFYCCWDGIQLVPKYQTKVKLISNNSFWNIWIAKKWKPRCIFHPFLLHLLKFCPSFWFWKNPWTFFCGTFSFPPFCHQIWFRRYPWTIPFSFLPLSPWNLSPGSQIAKKSMHLFLPNPFRLAARFEFLMPAKRALHTLFARRPW